jgi:hypothetical protein
MTVTSALSNLTGMSMIFMARHKGVILLSGLARSWIGSFAVLCEVQKRRRRENCQSKEGPRTWCARPCHGLSCLRLCGVMDSCFSTNFQMSRQMQPRYDHGSLVQAVRACANDDATDLIAVAGEHSVHVIQVVSAHQLLPTWCLNTSPPVGTSRPQTSRILSHRVEGHCSVLVSKDCIPICWLPLVH